MPEQQDQVLLEGLKNGERAVLQEIYKEFAPKVSAWIVKHGGQQEEAKDIFQESIVAIYDKVAGQDFQLPCSFGAYFMGIIRYKWLDKKNRNKRDQEVRNQNLQRYTDENDPNIEDLLIATEQAHHQAQRLEHSFKQLSDLCQQLLTLIKGGRSTEEIIQTLSFSTANALYRRKNACLERWRTLLSEA
ncbi:MAG: RNA polymerase sigma factor [Saprospiraceae bacterium]|nr:RNA polymerase sigma factor [Saprospiraceae bacterium]